NRDMSIDLGSYDQDSYSSTEKLINERNPEIKDDRGTYLILSYSIGLTYKVWKKRKCKAALTHFPSRFLGKPLRESAR
ncbi:hypothetical protein ACLOJK_012228, partial [Asimina triloba]